MRFDSQVQTFHCNNWYSVKAMECVKWFLINSRGDQQNDLDHWVYEWQLNQMNQDGKFSERREKSLWLLHNDLVKSVRFTNDELVWRLRDPIFTRLAIEPFECSCINFQEYGKDILKPTSFQTLK
jgi:hypothetical protein